MDDRYLNTHERQRSGTHLPALAPSSHDENSILPETPPAHLLKTSSKASTACKACQKRRTKCSGKPLPCQACVSRGTDCVLNPAADGRRKGDMRRLASDLQVCCDAFDGLTKALRDGPPARVDLLLDWVRYSKRPRDIVDYAHQFSSLLEVAESDRMSTPPGTVDRSSAANIATDTGSATCPGSVIHEPEEGVAFGETVNPDRLETVVGINGSSLVSPEGRPSRIHDNADAKGLYQRLQASCKEESEASTDLLGLAHIGRRDQGYSRDQSEESRSILPLSTSPWPSRSEGDPLVALSQHTVPIPQSIFTGSKMSRYLALPYVLFDSSPRSRLYTDYIHGATKMLQAGVPAADILGSHEWIPVDLLFRPREAQDKFDCASWACEISRNQTRDIFVRLASVYLLTRMMQVSLWKPHSTWWQLSPDELAPSGYCFPPQSIMSGSPK